MRLRVIKDDGWNRAGEIIDRPGSVAEILLMRKVVEVLPEMDSVKFRQRKVKADAT